MDMIRELARLLEDGPGLLPNRGTLTYLGALNDVHQDKPGGCPFEEKVVRVRFGNGPALGRAFQFQGDEGSKGGTTSAVIRGEFAFSPERIEWTFETLNSRYSLVCLKAENVDEPDPFTRGPVGHA